MPNSTNPVPSHLPAGDLDPELTPVCVDLERALVRNSYLAESIAGALRTRPFLLFLLPFWLLKGRSYFAQEIYKHSYPDAGLLPYDSQVISSLVTNRNAGNPLYLVCNIPSLQAREIADHFGIFQRILTPDDLGPDYGSDPEKCLAAYFGGRPEAYLGRPRANASILHQLKVYLRAARLHQWVKNSLLFVPLLLSHQFTQPLKWASAVLAFVSFSLCASSFYLFNDLFDIEADRAHPRKRSRPFASGDLSVYTGFWLLLAGLAGTVFSAWYLPLAAAQLIAVYAAANFLYSAFLKQFLFLDTVVLAFLYTLRILVGGAATQIEVSVWTLAFSVFFFLGLALLKRVVELVSSKENVASTASRRAYTAADLASVNSFASSALFISVLITVLYINSPDVVKLYRHPQFLWLISLPLLYWIGRLLTLANRGTLTDDPIVFAFRDRASYLVGLAVLVCAFLAT